MSEILGATGSTSPINPIRKKELDDKWKEIENMMGDLKGTKYQLTQLDISHAFFAALMANMTHMGDEEDVAEARRPPLPRGAVQASRLGGGAEVRGGRGHGANPARG